MNDSVHKMLLWCFAALCLVLLFLVGMFCWQINQEEMQKNRQEIANALAENQGGKPTCNDGMERQCRDFAYYRFINASKCPDPGDNACWVNGDELQFQYPAILTREYDDICSSRLNCLVQGKVPYRTITFAVKTE